MIILYNLVHILILLPLLPLLFIYLLAKKKYRSHIPKRLGYGLKGQIKQLPGEKKRIWIHALSVGEVTSALSLVEKIRNEEKNVSLIFSSSTRTGYEHSKKTMADHCDVIIPFPLDIFPVVQYFLRICRPDVFILVETDFWPNILYLLNKKNIPTLLVNGRISEGAFQRYSQFSFFFSPMFSSFTCLCLQTAKDIERMKQLGISKDRLFKLGNLKYTPVEPPHKNLAAKFLSNVVTPLFVAGSTHPGEEEILLKSFLQIQAEFNIRMIIAPRDITRAQEIKKLAQSMEITTQLRTDGEPLTGDLLILDSLGELTSFYAFGSLCFVGGSLVNHGGHNPLEPAAACKPVLFGPFMQDFHEIVIDLQKAGCGFTVSNQVEIYELALQLLQNPQHCSQIAGKADQLIQQKKCLIDDHLQLIRKNIS